MLILMVGSLAACQDKVKTQATTESVTKTPDAPDTTSKVEATTVVPESAAPAAVEQKKEATTEVKNGDGSTTETTKKVEVSK